MDARNAAFCKAKRIGTWMGKAAGEGSRTRPAVVGSCCNSRIGPLVEFTVQALFCQLQISVFEGSLARKLRFDIFNFLISHSIVKQICIFSFMFLREI